MRKMVLAYQYRTTIRVQYLTVLTRKKPRNDNLPGSSDIATLGQYDCNVCPLGSEDCSGCVLIPVLTYAADV
jgi:hypothetical protein